MMIVTVFLEIPYCSDPTFSTTTTTTTTTPTPPTTPTPTSTTTILLTAYPRP